SLRVDSKTPLVGFSGEHSWPLGEVPLEITIGDSSFLGKEILNFVIVRSSSPHNLLLVRTAMQQMGIMISTIHGAIKFHTPRGTDTIFLIREPNEADEEIPKGQHRCLRMDLCSHDRNSEDCSGSRQDTTFLENIEELHKWEDGLVDDRSRKSLSKHERVHRDINNGYSPNQRGNFDGASSSDGSRAGLMLVSPKGKQYTYTLRFEFKTTNKETKYEALLARLPIAAEMKIQKLAIFVDSQLVANQVKWLFEARKPVIKQYLEKTKEILKSFNSYSIKHVRRDQNKKADALSKLASMTFSKLSKEVLVEVVQEKSIIQKEVAYIVKEEGDNWMLHIHEYL
ncbi:reverse transcriptase domain-containing protein, partial [Tanacetum coccineum]